MIDYKISEIIDNGKTKKMVIRFYSGAMQDMQEKALLTAEPKTVSKYVRDALLSVETFEFGINDDFVGLLNKKLAVMAKELGAETIEAQSVSIRA